MFKTEPKQSKLKQGTREMMKERGTMNKNTPEFQELNKVIRKKVRQDVRNYNIKVIEDIRNMKVIRTQGKGPSKNN